MQADLPPHITVSKEELEDGEIEEGEIVEEPSQVSLGSPESPAFGSCIPALP